MDSDPRERLKAYVDANAGRFTDEAITAELTRAGYAAEDIRAALAEGRRPAVAPPTRRAVVTILAAYGVTFALLSLGMLVNTYRVQYGPDAIGGIMVLAGSLGFALLLSFAWVGSRRVAGLILAAFLGFVGVGWLSTTGGGDLIGFVILGIAIGLAVLAFRRGPAPTTRSTATFGVLLSVPVILLVIVAGLCIATGMPIPRAG